MATRDASDLTGGATFDRFEIVAVLTRGASSTTYRARQEGLGREVALKVFRPSVFAGDEEMLAEARREATRVARLEHPGIAATYVAGVEEGCLFIAGTLLDGDTFEELVVRRAITPADTAQMAEQVGAALGYAHAQGIVHRDLRPGCIVRDRWGHAVVRDFGLARASGRTGHLTQAQVLASLRHTAPELLLGRPVAPATDVYGLASTVVWCLSGQPPFGDRPTAEYLMHRASAPAPRISVPGGHDVSAVQAVLDGAMAVDPDARPGLEAFVADLGSALGALDPGLRSAASPFSVSEGGPVQEAAAGAAPVAAVPEGATRVEHRRPLPPKPQEASGRRRWEFYAAGATVALASAAAAFGVARLTLPEAPAPLQVGPASTPLGDTWTRAAGGTPQAQLPDGVNLRGQRDESATVGWLPPTNPPGDPLFATARGNDVKRAVPARAGGVEVVRYEGGDSLVIARPTTKGSAVAACSRDTPVERCAALVTNANVPGKALAVSPSEAVQRALATTMIELEKAAGVASAALLGEKEERASGAREHGAALRKAATGLELKGVDPGTAKALTGVRRALLDQAEGLDALSEAIDRRSDARVRAARKEIRDGEDALRVALRAFRRAGYPIQSGESS